MCTVTSARQKEVWQVQQVLHSDNGTQIETISHLLEGIFLY